MKQKESFDSDVIWYKYTSVMETLEIQLAKS